MMVGIGLAALMTGLFAWLRTDISRMGERLDKRQDGLDKRIDDLRQEMKQDIAALRADMDKRLDDLDGRFRTVEHGQAKLEGLLEGLREAIAGRKDAA